MAPPKKSTDDIVPPATSPSGLLWACQMKRENAAIMSRMQKLESELGRVETSTSARDEGSEKIKGLEKRIDALSKKNEKDREQLGRESRERYQDLQGDVKAITTRVDALGEGLAVVKRFEEELREYELTLFELQRFVDEERFGALREMLADMKERLDGRDKENEDVQEKLQVLEGATQSLKEVCEDLKGQVENIAAKPVRQVPVAGGHGITDGRASGMLEIPAPKKAAAKKGTSKDAAVRSAPTNAANSVAAPKARTTRATVAVDTTQIQDPAAPSPTLSTKEKKFVGAGRGRIEIARTPSNEPGGDVESSGVDFVAPNGRRGRCARETKVVNPTEEPVSAKRGPGRPRKNKAQLASSASKGKEPAEIPVAVARGTKRKAEAGNEEPAARITRSQAPKEPSSEGQDDQQEPESVANPQPKSKNATVQPAPRVARGQAVKRPAVEHDEPNEGPTNIPETPQSRPAVTSGVAQKSKRTIVLTPLPQEGQQSHRKGKQKKGKQKLRCGPANRSSSPPSTAPENQGGPMRQPDFLGKGQKPNRVDQVTAQVTTENLTVGRPTKKRRSLLRDDEKDEELLKKYSNWTD
ncbi:Hypothetical predicted protein [Lecanosticta acicola]|uniref:Uncharacterized protein n=1 Tax=Lecanosticta acicola TaxID=111012 RepID=A0AAI9ECR9_9PEZI|nr:Hypothetical predicted protein [Lecanosticta acicola]